MVVADRADRRRRRGGLQLVQRGITGEIRAQKAGVVLGALSCVGMIFSRPAQIEFVHFLVGLFCVVNSASVLQQARKTVEDKGVVRKEPARLQSFSV